MPARAIHHVDLAVADLDRSLAFYTTVLGPLGVAVTERYPSYRGTEEVAYMTVGDQALGYFEPVARFPGFARALASTLGELRLAGIAPAALGALPARARGPGHDVQVLLSRFEDALRTRGLADRPGLFALAAAALASDAPVPLAGLPTVLLDVAVTSPSERMLVGALARRAPAVSYQLTTASL